MSKQDALGGFVGWWKTCVPHLQRHVAFRYRRAVCAWISADDVVQETAVRAFLHRDVLTPLDINARQAWVRRTAQRIMVDIYRMQTASRRGGAGALHVGLDVSGAEPLRDVRHAPEGPQEHEVSPTLMQELASLPERQGQAIHLHHLKRLSVQETATLMRTTDVAIKCLCTRGLATLRRRLSS